ncbi:MAG: hypothetical protein ACR2NW_09260 [Thermodesulfobacteriota bacterium]
MKELINKENSNILVRLKNAGININNGGFNATRDQIERFYDVPKRTLAYNIRKLKEDKMITGQKVALYSESKKRQYDVEVFNAHEVVRIGFRIRSSFALLLQEAASNLIVNQLGQAYEQIQKQQKRLHLQQAQLDHFWDKEDIKDLYKR